MNTIDMRVLSSLEKVFPDESLSGHSEQLRFTVLQDQTLAFQVGIHQSGDGPYKVMYALRLSGELASSATVRMVTNLPSMFSSGRISDGAYLRKTPGLYPDLLRPLQYQNRFWMLSDQPQALWITLHTGACESGVYSMKIELLHADSGEVCAEREVEIRVSALSLPEQKTIHTEWFYTDCIAQAHRVKVFSRAHWRLIERYLRVAVENGINMILTPVFTPALDTYVGGERLTTQLLDITVTSDGRYVFDFSKLKHWIELCRSIGVKYYEIPHFFTQWGAAHAPKIMARVNGRKKQIFGWSTDSCGQEYRSFLAQMIPALLNCLESCGVADHTFFHISDEPHLEFLEQYQRCKEMVEPYLKGAPIIDALSDFAFYESGALKKPAVATSKIKPFLEHEVLGLWAYYCGTGSSTVSSRMLAMPTARTRVLGVQLYLADIEGFLHWGYNFYNNQYSYDTLDPLLFTDGEFFVPSGDTCLVYPGTNDTVWESIRLNAMREAMEDIRTLQLCESVCGRAAVERLIRETAGMEIDFEVYPTDPAFLLTLRERAIEMTEAALGSV